MATQTLHIHHASLNGRTSALSARIDSDLMFSRGADVVTVTEMGAEPQRGEWQGACRRAGYRALVGRGGQAIAWKDLKVIDSGITQVIDDPAGPVRGHRDLPWVKFEFANRKITVCSTHWVDDVEQGGERRDQWYRQTNAVIDRMERAVEFSDDNIGFFTGDVNVHFDKSGPAIDPYRAAFNDGGLRMVWAEISQWPDTGPHGGTIDVIGRKGGAAKVVALRAQVYTSGAVTSDHNPISAWYQIEVVDSKPGGGGDGGGGSGSGGTGGDGDPLPPYNPPPEGPPPPPTTTSGKGRASLGGVPFRLNPTSVNWTFRAKVADIATVGGKVIQVLGTDVSDLMVSGTFGAGGWREQQAFLDRMKRFSDRSVDGRSPLHFRYPTYGWDFRVILKAYSSRDGTKAVVLDNEIIAPHWDLTLFVVEGSSALNKVATDAYIARLSRGIGWKQTKYNGPMGIHALDDLLGGMSVEEYLEQQYGLGAVPTGNVDYEPQPGEVGGGGGGGPYPVSGLKGRARTAMNEKGWDDSHWPSLDSLVTHESSWSPTAQNPTSTAYGLFQFLDATWAGVGGTKTSDPDLQIEYGLRYIKNRYESPKGAWAFWQANNWY